MKRFSGLVIAACLTLLTSSAFGADTVKIGVAGPLKLRLDYRLFRLQGAPLHAAYHRFYAGATLGF